MKLHRLVAGGLAFCTWAAGGLLSAAVQAQPAPAALTPEQQCAALVARSFEAPEAVAKVTSAVYEPGRGPPAGEEARHYAERGKLHAVPTAGLERIPAHCRVQGYVAPHVRFEMALPAQRWNRRMLLAACHGWCGQLNGRDCVMGLVRDYATVTTDGGHTGLSSFDGVWAYNNPQAEIDFGHRANHVVALAAKAIIYPAGTPMGSEGAWPGWVLPTADAPVPRSWRGADQYLKYVAFEQDPGPGYDFRDYDLDTALETLKPMSPVYDALSTDLNAFQARGGKLIILHGMADEAIPAPMTIQYYEEMSEAMGGEAATRDEAPIYQRTLLPYAKGRPFVE